MLALKFSSILGLMFLLATGVYASAGCPLTSGNAEKAGWVKHTGSGADETNSSACISGDTAYCYYGNPQVPAEYTVYKKKLTSQSVGTGFGGSDGYCDQVGSGSECFSGDCSFDTDKF